jgi:hypothetical protein
MKQLYFLLFALGCSSWAYSQSKQPNIEKQVAAFLATKKLNPSQLLQEDILIKENKSLKRTVDSVTELHATSEKSNAVMFKNFELYSLITQFRKDSVAIFTKRFPELFVQNTPTPTLNFSNNVNLGTVQQYSGNGDLKGQFPQFYTALESHAINIAEEPALEMALGAAGMQMPQIPSLTISNNDNNKSYQNLYFNYSQWMAKYIQFYDCDPAYLTVFDDRERQLPVNTSWKQKAEYRRILIEFLMKKCH